MVSEFESGLVVYECVTGHWCGEFAALTHEKTCPICGSPVSCETDEPVFVRSNAVRIAADYDPNAVTK